jgi:hypothetical protein
LKGAPRIPSNVTWPVDYRWARLLSSLRISGRGVADHARLADAIPLPVSGPAGREPGQGEHAPPHAVDAALKAYRDEGRRLAATERGVDLVERASTRWHSSPTDQTS